MRGKKHLVIAIVVLGLIIGSFLSVCIYRIPHGRQVEQLNPGEDISESANPAESEEANAEAISIISPSRSFCPHCRNQLKWWHNLPLLSWLMLGGKCAFCRTPISMRYPLVELMSAMFAVMCLNWFGLSATAALIYLFCAALIVISFIDYDYYIIPNVISLPGTAIGLALALLNHFTGIFAAPITPTIWDALLGILVGAGFLLFISEGYLRLRKKEGLGMGDVKLLAMVGALFGVRGALYTIFVGSLLGSVLGVLLILLSGRKFSHQLPFGPYLALGTILYIFAGERPLIAFMTWLTGGVVVNG